ncbi:thioredoxin H1 isoform 1 [Tropilaelaps mercedesae]|uniref:Thioredoxin n=1 Tax=Tropilaelaps mercedesae TaxID=418985 RepID=A0A1V9XK55_9ACAR|nr:thioredoxin H1 isoform 1 [Tropilaelaps mercedesae]
MIQQVKSFEEYKKFITTPGKVVFVDFYATWCGPCKFISPEFEKLSTQYPDCLFIKVDVEEVEKASEENNVSNLPTFMAFKDGKKIDDMVGADVENLRKFVAKNQA